MTAAKARDVTLKWRFVAGQFAGGAKKGPHFSPKGLRVAASLEKYIAESSRYWY